MNINPCCSVDQMPLHDLDAPYHSAVDNNMYVVICNITNSQISVSIDIKVK